MNEYIKIGYRYECFYKSNVFSWSLSSFFESSIGGLMKAKCFFCRSNFMNRFYKIFFLFILNCSSSNGQLYTEEYETIFSNGISSVSVRKMFKPEDVLNSIPSDFPGKGSVIPDKEFFASAVNGLEKEILIPESFSLHIDNINVSVSTEKNRWRFFFPYYSDTISFKTVIVSKLSFKKKSFECFHGDSSVFESSERTLNLKVYSFLPVPAWMELLRYASSSVYGIFLIFAPVPYHYYHNKTETLSYSELVAKEYKTHLMEVIRNAKEKNLFRKCE